MLVAIGAVALPSAKHSRDGAMSAAEVGLSELTRMVAHKINQEHLHQSLERERTAQSTVEVPVNAFWTKKGVAREPSILVRQQRATCPEAQCPRAKMENVGYLAKGYNLLKGNPYSSTPGVDPGFVDRAGGLIWDLAYEQNKETADGRFQVPDDTIIEHNEGCSLSMTTTTSSNTKDLEETFKVKVGVDVDVTSGVYNGKFSANTEVSGFTKQNSKEMTTDITSNADCVVYHAKLPTFSRKPKLTDNFLEGVANVLGLVGAGGRLLHTPDLELERSSDALVPEDQWDKEELKPYYRFFDEFGTHWQKYTKMGARYGLTTKIKEVELEKLENSGVSVEVSASIAWMKAADDCPGSPCDKEEKLEPGYRRQNAFREEQNDDDEWAGSDREFDLERRGQSHMLHKQKLLRYKSSSGPAKPGMRPSKIYSEHMGWETRWVDEFEPRVTTHRLVSGSSDGSSEGLNGSALERKVGQVGGKVNVDTTSKSAEKLESKSDSMKIISFGAKPKGNVLEWAEQTEDENMPIIYQLGGICELVELALHRDFVSEDRMFCDAHDTSNDGKCGHRCLAKVTSCEKVGKANDRKPLKLCTVARAGDYCVANTDTNEKCGTENAVDNDANMCDVSGSMRTVYYVVPAKEQLKQSDIDDDKNGILQKVSKNKRNEVVAKCKEAQRPEHYCMYVKKQEGLETMNCQAAAGGDADGIERPKPECTSDFECEDKKSPLHNKCVDNKCVMKYKRITDVAMVAHSSRNNNHCSDGSLRTIERGGQGEYHTVEVEGDVSGWKDAQWLNQIRGRTSEMAIRLCVKESDGPVVDADVDTHGVCHMLLSRGGGCDTHGGLSFDLVSLGMRSDGNFRQDDKGPSLYLCLTKDGCEGRSGDDKMKPTKALSKVGLNRGDGNCPSSMSSGTRIWQKGNDVTGDFNQGMWSGGTVRMCEATAAH